jgi:CMP-N,N'-diacetyllegionaminic acid synthase
MINDKILIFGYGSIAIKHKKFLTKLYPKKKIFIYSKRKIKIKNIINKLKDILLIKPQYVIICSNTKNHFKDLIFFENNFKNINILVEKPLFDKIYSYKFKNNKIFVGYNLRFDPIIQFIKNKIRSKKIWVANIACGSYLPNWRKNIKYNKTYSSKKNQGGGVVLDLSHEFDYVTWFFGKLSKKFSLIDKVSNLKINSEDYCNFYGSAKKCKHISIYLDYFSRIPYRLIFLKGKNFFLKANLLKKKITYFENNKHKVFKHDSSNYDYSYLAQLRNFISFNGKNLSCYNDGLRVLKIISKIKKNL